MNYRDAALGASEWLLAQAVETPRGLAWPENAGETELDHSLYGGTAGVLLTMLDAHEATGDVRFRDAAERAGAQLADHRDSAEWDYNGFYVGLAGVGFALQQLDAAAAAPIIAVLRDRAEEAFGARPSDAWTDILYGDAGVVCWLVSRGEPDLADVFARRLLDAALPTKQGAKWPVFRGHVRFMPNFSHGAAGIAFALARAGYLDDAVRAADYLVSVADRSDGGFRVFHYEPGGESLFPLGWCHGPSGTARLFQLLADTTGEAKWEEVRDACAHTVRSSGIPERKEPGFWDNVAACCGSTAVAKFFLGLHRRTGRDDDIAFVRLMADDIVRYASVDDVGVRWSNIEHTLPDPVLPPGCGAMQGAAGIASFLFELDRYLNGDASYRRWPDDPF